MFDNFELKIAATTEGQIRLRIGGKGPATMLLHGHPRTHMTWGKVADALADHFTVICPDLPGFGGSFIPADSCNSEKSSKRAKAAVLKELMENLGFVSFNVVGHDRGSLTAFRLAMDYPQSVRRLITIDGLPVIEHLERADWKFARDWYHWFFFAQPEKPERAISSDPDAWYNNLSAELMGQEAYDDVLRAIHDPAVVHGMIEDYRASTRIDHLHDREDRDAGRQVQCKMLCLWSLRDDLQKIYGNPAAIWNCWARDVEGFGIDSGHHVAEENPEALASAITDFLLE
ncbi:alpha/beta hydrolase [Rhizobium sp. BK399]|uniref:alpha/beta fold hydrolase n=1 Tax=Rhizobium sp. BK399 TaxID=2587063 RepID=UPI0016220316|nr:alpha/beta hydrolase [Rhizobium sp. BK399]MBB3543903.1 haloacetate dehalogenase [Rhizobium sp. BK399]